MCILVLTVLSWLRMDRRIQLNQNLKSKQTHTLTKNAAFKEVTKCDSKQLKLVDL